jgi:uncharacterized protein
MNIIEQLSKELSIPESQISNTVALIDEGNTIPFIARYRKEVTGSLDDNVLRELSERLAYLRKLDARREEVRALIAAQEKLTDEISSALDRAAALVEVEDIYRPFRPQRKTRASVARERGLEGLAKLIFEQRAEYSPSILESAAEYVNEEKGVPTTEDAINGACDIIAEDISTNAEFRKKIRILFHEYGFLVSTKTGDAQSVYESYYDFREPLKRVRYHRVLAIARGEREEFLKVSVDISSDIVLNYLCSEVISNPNSPASKFMLRCVSDSYDRLIFPSVEREIRAELFEQASEGAIKLFSENLRNLLMQAPLRGKVVLGFDPGYRTGCKLAVVDKGGMVLDTAVIYPTKPQERIEESRKVVCKLIDKYKIDVIAIGNGTASKESEIFISDTIKNLSSDVKYTMVSEAGASVYSASKAGAEEFPDFDVTERSAVSIARRLQDPLAELVKIDPKSIGVGQYQHDMKQARLDEALTGVVESCVNSVGVDLNTASYSLLSYVSGISATAAKNVVSYRYEHGSFKSRTELLKVPKIGAKAYEQCAGFLRVVGSDEVLDNTGVHPESYTAAHKLLKLFDYSDSQAVAGLSKLRGQVNEYGISNVCRELDIGEPTLLDIVTELEKPGRDIRDALPQPTLRTDVMDINSLKEGMVLKGTVRNVVDFGAFIDIGVHCDGLLHISEMSDKFIKHPRELLSVGDILDVYIKGVDTVRQRISLTLKTKQ